MLTWTLTTNLFLPTSSMQSIPTGRGISCLNKPQAPRRASYQHIEPKKTSQHIKSPHKEKRCRKEVYDELYPN